jgi:hypothetical protein
MNSTPLLITYYNNIPPDATNYFTFSNSKLIISKNDMMLNLCSELCDNANNNLVYIFCGANIGAFSIKSLVSSNNNSFTYSIDLYSIPLNLTNNILFVLSLTVPTYNITRTFITTLNDRNNNFTLENNNKFIINTNSESSDDTLFLYIIATNKSFNIIYNATTINTISNVEIFPVQSNSYTPAISPSIAFTGTIQPLSFTSNKVYTIYISTENSSTISNLIFNNTRILPLNYSGIDLRLSSSRQRSLNGTPYDISRAESNTLEVTPVLLDQKLTVNKNNLNNQVLTQSFVNKCVILNIINSIDHDSSGKFSLEKINTLSNELIVDTPTNMIENFTNLIERMGTPTPSPTITSGPSDIPGNNSIYSSLLNFGNIIIDSAKTASKDTYNTVINTTGISNETVISSTEVIQDVSKNAYDNLSYAYKVVNVNYQPKTKPDIINNIPLIVGLPTKLNVSYSDINNHDLSYTDINDIKVNNFITSNIFLFLSNGLKNYIYTVSNSINNIPNPDRLTILSFNGEINSSVYPEVTENTPYVLSTTPISPYKIYSYVNSISSDNIINNSTFSFIQDNKLIISNIDVNSKNSTSFILLLYTIINTPVKLNILNLDYSIVCSLNIINVALGPTQSTISYSLGNGVLPNSSTNNYILTLLQSTDIINSINNTRLYKDTLIKNNNLILGIQNSIYNSSVSNPNDLNIKEAQNIIDNAANQSNILLHLPFIDNNFTSTIQIANATIIMSFNAINYAILFDPNSGELQYFYSILTQLKNPIIVRSILNNALNHVINVINNNPSSSNLTLYINAKNSINNALSTIVIPSASDSLSLNTPSPIYNSSITAAISQINIALVADPDNNDLLKAHAILLTIDPIKSGKYNVETMTEDSKSSNNNSTIIIIIVIFVFIGIFIILGVAAYLINYYLTKSDKDFFSSNRYNSDRYNSDRYNSDRSNSDYFD